MLDGISIAPMGSPGNGPQMNFNAGAAQEVVVDTGAAAIDTVSGGVRIDVIPREGGNKLAATVFGSGTVSALQGSNLTQALKDQGIRTPDELAKQWDINPGFGGPIRQDRLWGLLHGAHRGHQELRQQRLLRSQREQPECVALRPRFEPSRVQLFHRGRRPDPPDVAGVAEE